MWQMLGSLLLFLVEPIVSRVVGAFGFGIVSYTGVKVIYDKLELAMSNLSGSLAHDIYSILSLSGFGDFLAINMAALLVRAYLDGMNNAGAMVRSTFSSGG